MSNHDEVQERAERRAGEDYKEFIEDYERDRRGYWILKTKPKKKFGFWG